MKSFIQCNDNPNPTKRLPDYRIIPPTEGRFSSAVGGGICLFWALKTLRRRRRNLARRYETNQEKNPNPPSTFLLFSTQKMIK